MTQADLIALEDRRWKAVIGCDWAALEAIVDEDLVYTHAHAHVDDKQGYIAGLKASNGSLRSVERSDECVRMLGDSTGFVAGALKAVSRVDGAPKLSSVRFISIWTSTSAGWKFIGWQSTANPAKA